MSSDEAVLKRMCASEVVDFLAKLAKIPSENYLPYSEKGREKEVGGFLASGLDKMGMELARQKTHHSDSPTS